jgi:CubicO group peptidase (beta-lactamase class C family)
MSGFTRLLRQTALAMLTTVVVVTAPGATAMTITSYPHAAAAPLHAGVQLPSSLVAEVDAYLKGLVKHQQFAGSVLIAHRGTILFSKGYGLADVVHHVPNTPQTQFRLAHVTKQFTAVAILLLQDRGKLHVQDHICRYLTGCPAAWRLITIHQCLNQTSGLPDDDPSTVTAATPADLIRTYEELPLGFTAGSQFGFSDVGYVVLSQIIAKVSGEPFAVFMQKHIFDYRGSVSLG